MSQNWILAQAASGGVIYHIYQVVDPDFSSKHIKARRDCRSGLSTVARPEEPLLSRLEVAERLMDVPPGMACKICREVSYRLTKVS